MDERMHARGRERGLIFKCWLPHSKATVFCLFVSLPTARLQCREHAQDYSGGPFLSGEAPVCLEQTT